MQRLLMTGLVVLGFVQAVPSFGLVRLVTNCQTSDGKYDISILDNQGIGLNRTSSYSASIRNQTDAVVASYGLTYVKPSGSISFGHASFLDTATQGKKFNFAYPSTNFPYALAATLADGTEIHYGRKIDPNGLNQGSLICK